MNDEWKDHRPLSIIMWVSFGIFVVLLFTVGGNPS